MKKPVAILQETRYPLYVVQIFGIYLPAKVLPLHVQRRLHAHYLSIVDQDFVEELQEVAKEHKRHDAPIDFAVKRSIVHLFDVASSCFSG